MEGNHAPGYSLQYRPPIDIECFSQFMRCKHILFEFAHGLYVNS